MKMCDEFQPGDVIVRIGYLDEKWVITDRSNVLDEYEMLSVCRSFPDKFPIVMDKGNCERLYVKVGRYDFRKEMEVEDEES